MTYDFHGGWETVIGHHSPWTSDGTHPGDKHNQLTVKRSTEYWIESGCIPEKMTMGLGTYGRVFKPEFKITVSPKLQFLPLPFLSEFQFL